MKIDIEKLKKQKMEMCNFQISEDDHKKLKEYLKKNKVKKCDFFRAVIEQIK
jgi:hypothetical protein